MASWSLAGGNPCSRWSWMDLAIGSWRSSLTENSPPPGARGPGNPALVELDLSRQLLFAPEPVSAPMRRLVEAGGKRLRPTLVQLTAGIGPRNQPLPAAALAAGGRAL